MQYSMRAKLSYSCASLGHEKNRDDERRALLYDDNVLLYKPPLLHILFKCCFFICDFTYIVLVPRDTKFHHLIFQWYINILTIHNYNSLSTAIKLDTKIVLKGFLFQYHKGQFLCKKIMLYLQISCYERMATLMRALSTCDKQNLLQWWRRTPRKRRRLLSPWF